MKKFDASHLTFVIPTTNKYFEFLLFIKIDISVKIFFPKFLNDISVEA